MFGKINTVMIDDFTIVDESGTRYTGVTGFTFELWNPSNVNVSSTGITVTVTELGTGSYRASYTPNVIGIWKLVIYHATYFPAGKDATHRIYINDIDSIGAETDKIKYVLGLSQENFRIYDQVYNVNGNMTSATVRVYSTKTDADADTNQLATYTVTATFSGNSCTAYKMTKD